MSWGWCVHLYRLNCNLLLSRYSVVKCCFFKDQENNLLFNDSPYWLWKGKVWYILKTDFFFAEIFHLQKHIFFIKPFNFPLVLSKEQTLICCYMFQFFTENSSFLKSCGPLCIREQSIPKHRTGQGYLKKLADIDLVVCVI